MFGKYSQVIAPTNRYIDSYGPGRLKKVVRAQKSLIAGAGLGLLWSVEAFGLGLGDIELKSGLNQPLDAEIELVAVKPDELNQIKIDLASDSAFLTAGVEYSSLLTELVFSVRQRADGGIYVQVTTQKPVKEPFLDFLIEANWPTGRLLREYTLLLDPPVFVEESTAVVETPVAGAVPQVSQVSEATTQVTDALPAAPAQLPFAESVSVEAPQPIAPASQPDDASVASGTAMPSEVAGTYGPVKPNETLWQIADKLGGKQFYSIEQVMMGLYKTNPEAFIKENINNLKAGYVLRAPEEATVTALDHNEAAKQARAHYSEWLAAKRLAKAAAAQVASTEAGLAARTDVAPESEASATGSDEAQLRLVSPEEGAAAGGLAAEGGEGVSDTDLALAMETAEAVKVENEELRTRIASLEEQLTMMERLVTLKDDALVELQRHLGSEPTEHEPSGEVREEIAADETPLSAVTEEVDVAQVDENAQPAVAPPVTAKKPPVVAVEEPVVDDSWTSILADWRVLAVGIGVLLLLGAIVWTIVRRRQASEEEFEDAFATPPEFAVAETAEAVAVTQEAAEVSGPEEPAFANLEEQDASGLDALEADEAEIDPVAEAEVYLAYRRFQQAEELIKQALQNEPTRHDLQLKLLEIHFGAGNKESFEAQAEAFYALLGGEEGALWGKVEEMGHELCPEHPLFGGSAPAVAALGAGDVSFAGTSEFQPEQSVEDAASFLGGLEQAESEVAAAHPGEMEFEDTSAVDALSTEALRESDEGLATGVAPFETTEVESTAQADQDMDELASILEGLDEVAASEREADNIVEFEAGLGQGADVLRDSDNAEIAESQRPTEESKESAENSIEFNIGPVDLNELAKESVEDEAKEEVVASLNTSATESTKAGDRETRRLAENAVAGEAEELDFTVNLDETDLNLEEEAQLDQDDILTAETGEIEEVFTGLEDIDLGEEGEYLFANSDTVGTKLDLARAYIDMDDRDGARGILEEVLEEGSDDQRQVAEEMMQKIG